MKKIVVLLTACLLLLGITFSVAAEVTDPAPRSTMDYPDLNYSMDLNKAGAMYMGQVLEQLPDLQITEQEKSFIRFKFSGQNALYYTKPVVNGADYTYDGETERLTLLVTTDRYYAPQSGTTVYWTPYRASVGDSSALFEPAPEAGENYYRVVLDDVTWSQNVQLTLEYSADFTVNADTLNDFVNFAYQKALLLDEQHAQFEIDTEIYNAVKAEYDANHAEWERYHADMDAYGDYLDRVELYADYLVYQGFLEKVATYDAAYAAYLANQQAWQDYAEDCEKYEEYLKYKEQYPALYDEYVAKQALVQHQLDLLQLMTIKDPASGVSFMEMMIDDRITQIIADKYVSLSALTSKSVVDAVVESAPIVQDFCKEYLEKPNDQERYVFYIRKYSLLVKHLGQLYTNIKKLYEVPAVYTELMKTYPDSAANMVRMMGALYVYSCTFNDKVDLQLSTIVDTRNNKKASSLVDVSLRPASDDNNATPFDTWPQAPIKPESMEVTAKPTEPAVTLTPPTYPTLPDFSFISKPDELPEHMEDPGIMTEPTPPAVQLPHPGNQPSLGWDDTTQALYDLYVAGKIVQRPEYDTAQTVNLCAPINYSVTLSEDERCYFVYFYNTDEEGTYLGCSTGVYPGESASVPESLQSATKPPVRDMAFEFVEWLDASGQPLDLTNMTGDVYAYASYRVVERICTVVWDVGDVPVVQQYPYGAMPVFEGATEKSPDAQYVYLEFLGWDKPIAAVTDDVTYTAQYEKSINRHKVTFVMGDGSLVEREYNYGWSIADVAASLPKPYKAPDSQYTYTFKGWSDQHGNFYASGEALPTLAGPTVYTAEFDAVANFYTVTWVVDGQQITSTWEYGQMPFFGEAEGDIPQKQPTERNVFEFTGWDSMLATVTADATYTAQFVPRIRYYKIDFVVDGVVHTQMLEYEQTPKFEGDLTKPSDVQYEYSFLGWDNQPVPVREDAVYTARFGSMLRKYPVRFIVDGNEIIHEFEYGTMPAYPYGTPEKADDAQYRYVFSGWHQPVIIVDGRSLTYRAEFEAVPLAPVADGEPARLEIREDGSFALYVDGNSVDLSLLIEKAEAEQAPMLQVRFGALAIEIPREQLEAFVLMSSSPVHATLVTGERDGHVTLTPMLTDGTGEALQYLVTELTLRFLYDGPYTADVYLLEQDGTLTLLPVEYVELDPVISVMEPATYVLVDKYRIIVPESEMGVVDVIGEAYAGDKITFTPDPHHGYHLESVQVTCDGKEIEITRADGVYSFVMPNGNVTVQVVYHELEGGTAAEVLVGILTALLIVAIGIVIAVIIRKRRPMKA